MTDKDFDKPHTPAEIIDEHRDPITGAPHSHPTATGVGAAAAGIIATAAGALAAGPLGAIAGAIVGSGAGGLVGHTVGENNERKELAEAGADPNINSRLVEEDFARNATDTTHLEPGVPSRTGGPTNGPLAAPLPLSARDVPNSGDFAHPQTSAPHASGDEWTAPSVESTRQYNDSALSNSLSPSLRDAKLLEDDSDDIVGVVVVEETTIIAAPNREFGDEFKASDLQSQRAHSTRFDSTQPSPQDVGGPHKNHE